MSPAYGEQGHGGSDQPEYAPSVFQPPSRRAARQEAQANEGQAPEGMIPFQATPDQRTAAPEQSRPGVQPYQPQGVSQDAPPLAGLPRREDRAAEPAEFQNLFSPPPRLEPEPPPGAMAGEAPAYQPDAQSGAHAGEVFQEPVAAESSAPGGDAPPWQNFVEGHGGQLVGGPASGGAPVDDSQAFGHSEAPQQAPVQPGFADDVHQQPPTSPLDRVTEQPLAGAEPGYQPETQQRGAFAPPAEPVGFAPEQPEAPQTLAFAPPAEHGGQAFVSEQPEAAFPQAKFAPDYTGPEQMAAQAFHDAQQAEAERAAEAERRAAAEAQEAAKQAKPRKSAGVDEANIRLGAPLARMSDEPITAVQTPSRVYQPPALPEVDEQGRSIPRMHELMEEMIAAGASDLHITVGVPPQVRVRGELQALSQFVDLDAEIIQSMIFSMMSQRQREEFEKELELDFSYTLPDAGRFRVNVYKQMGAIGAVLRLIPFEIKTYEELSLPPVFQSFTNLQRGLLLVTGTTGSGKSTTLAAIVDSINRSRSAHILTVEDPVEFVHSHKQSIVNQREVHGDTRSFSKALRHALRQDPDVILVGEMRDYETISVALTAAETGHLVLGTLHTQDAPQTIDRIIDVFQPEQQGQVRAMLASSLQAVVCQQLCKTVKGQGRAPALEILLGTPAARSLIREAKAHQLYNVMQAGSDAGMQTMDQSLAALVRRGVISPDEGMQRCHHVAEFKRMTGQK